MKKIPVYVISGFLGSGKTTVLLHMINHFKKENKQPGIILNELGDENVEKHLFSEEKMIELLNGCICCTIQGDLKGTLQSLKNEPIDVLLIEGTGVANPLEIRDILFDPHFIDTFELQSMISIVDASHYLEYQSFFASSKEIRALLKEQIEAASLLIINKIDLVSEKELKKVERKILLEMNRDIPMYQTTHGEIPLEILLEKRVHVVEVSEQDHHHHHHIEAIKMKWAKPITRKQLEEKLKSLATKVIRAKGIVYLDTSNDLYEFQYAAKQLSVHKINENESPKIILIGKDLSKEEIERLFQEEN
ncbi:CobW family GTP-binding protein [Sutcliffiella cohnii]|uniref:CobW family GTP-binding protein n=1 Tax=Sutcliffiella TaxID=2837511 RepID=UPI0022DDDA34|nr:MULTISPECIES: GTP-binding protein [Sutcliffiella]MED4016068.1 GTP-binding protein [Sutcliffiella cohnii]WBL14228.1 GTP-binding protein [Sutcliffiella sp. NC1]